MTGRCFTLYSADDSEAGKSYSVLKWATNRKMKLGDKFKFYWMRLSDSSVKNLLAGGADKLIDPDIKRKYGLKTETKNHTVYTYKERETTDDKGRIKTEKYDRQEFCEVLACANFYNTKGVGYFDNEFEASGGEYFVVLDEMNREQSEKNCFDVVYNFVNLLENVIRSTKSHIRVVMIGNTLDEASDLLAAFNFIPNGFGRYKVKRKRLVVDYIRPNDNYLARRKGTAADLIMPGASTFTNKVDIDASLLVNKRRCVTPSIIIKFGKTSDTWFTVWNDNIIKPYNNEDLYAIAMIRYIDNQYNTDLVKSVFTRFDNRVFRFTNLSTLKLFQKHLKLIKK